MLSYIYKYTNKENGMVYIGQSVSPKERHYSHLSGKQEFDKELRKLGENAFTFEIIETVDIEEVNERETYWIAYYDSFHNGYNRTAGGRGFNIPKRVYCPELNLTFESLHQAGEGINCSLGLDLSIITLRKHMYKALNSLEETVFGLHLCSEELKEVYVADLAEMEKIL